MFSFSLFSPLCGDYSLLYIDHHIVLWDLEGIPNSYCVGKLKGMINLYFLWIGAQCSFVYLLRQMTTGFWKENIARLCFWTNFDTVMLIANVVFCFLFIALWCLVILPIWLTMLLSKLHCVEQVDCFSSLGCTYCNIPADWPSSFSIS